MVPVKGTEGFRPRQSDFHSRMLKCMWKISESCLTVAGAGRLGTGPEGSDAVLGKWGVRFKGIGVLPSFVSFRYTVCLR